jgi:hypothetical protein
VALMLLMLLLLLLLLPSCWLPHASARSCVPVPQFKCKREC